MAYEWRHQPFRGLYIAYQLILTLVFRVPYWTLISISPSTRPRKSWTFFQSLLVKILHYWGPLGHVPTVVGIFAAYPDHLGFAEGPTPSGEWIEPVPELITGDIKSIAESSRVEAARIPGYWYARPGFQLPLDEPAVSGEKVIYALHGGGYAFCSASPTDWVSEVPLALLRACPGIRRVFAVEYRLSVGAPYEPRDPFPAALLDALAGYVHLVRVRGFKPEDIIVEGDSAGGNLALALVRYLIEHQDDPALVADGRRRRLDGPKTAAAAKRGLPAPPRALVLLSPWTDLGDSHCTPGSSALECGATDVLLDLRSGAIEYAVRAFRGPLPAAALRTHAYISPAGKDAAASFRGFPRTYISVGAVERFLDQVRTLRDRMVRDMGEELVTYEEAPDAPHDYICAGHQPQAGITLQNIADWLSNDVGQ